MSDPRIQSSLKTFGIRKGRFLLAFSGGPDSVFLLEELASYLGKDLRKRIALAYVDYHDSPLVKEEEKTVLFYQKKYGLTLYRRDTHYRKSDKNFEDWARSYRYRFFAKTVKKENFDGLLTAHHQTDSLETYLLQKERGNLPKHYGLSPISEIGGLSVCRPLLPISKKEIYAALRAKKSLYYEDITNQDPKKKRNRIRKAGISAQESRKLLSEMEERNQDLSAFYATLEKIPDWVPFFAYDLLPEEKKRRLLFFLLERSGIQEKDHLSGLGKAAFDFLRKKENGEMRLTRKEAFFLAKRYEDLSYSYTYRKPGRYHNRYFEIDLTHPHRFNCPGFPLTVRSFRKGDRLSTDLPTKDVYRRLKKQQVPFYEIPLYPIFLFQGKIVGVPFYPDLKEKRIPLTRFLFPPLDFGKAILLSQKESA
jgi:tRNA(Ile)-lysidine synthetase-like protein